MSADDQRRGLSEAASRYLRERLSDPLTTGVLEYRALRYVWLLNDHGYTPTVEEFSAYADQPDRVPARRFEFLGAAAAQGLLTGLKGPAESVIDYLYRLRWIEPGDEDPPRVRITPLGRTICRALEARQVSESGDQALILDTEDPFAYAKFAERLGRMEDVLLVDAYFKLPELIELHPSDAIRRILVGTNLRPAERTSLGLALAGFPLVEVRVSQGVHDRFLIPPAGDVWLLGASVNGIGRKISAMVPLTGEAARQVREAHESLWADAEQLSPTPEGIGTESLPDD